MSSVKKKDYFVAGFFGSKGSWSFALVEHLRSQEKFILHDVRVGQSFDPGTFEKVLCEFDSTVKEFKSKMKEIRLNHADYEILFSRKSPKAEAIKEFSPDTAPDVLLGMLQGKIMAVVTDEMVKEIENDFKSITNPAALNHRIFAICIASVESRKQELFVIPVPFEVAYPPPYNPFAY